MLSFWSGKPVEGRTCDCHSQPMFFAGSSGYCCFTSVGSENSLQIGTVLVNPMSSCAGSGGERLHSALLICRDKASNGP